MNRMIPAVLALAAALCALAPAVMAQADYPSRPVRIVVPYPPGGTVDVFARIVGDKMGERLKQSFIVENKAGGNGIIGAEYALHAAPDGYTLLSSGAVVYSSAFVRNPPFDFLREFTPISQIYYGGLFFFVRADLPARNMKEFVDYARANPGKVNYGSPAPNTMLAMEVFKRQNNIDMLHVPYKGAGPTTAALLGGEVQVTLDTYTSYRSLVEAGKLRALAVTSDARAPALPGVPTLAEGGLPVLKAGSHGGFWAQAATPRDVVDKLNRAMVEVMKRPDVQEPLRASGVVPEGSTPEALRQAIVTEQEFWVSAAKTANYQPD